MMFFVLLLFLSILFDSSISISLVITWVLVFSWMMSDKQAIPAACGAGIVESLLSVRPLGWSIVVMVTLAGLVRLAAEQFSLRRGWWVVVSGVIGELLFRLSSAQGWSLVALVSQGVLVWGICSLYELFGKKEGVYLRK